MQTNHFESDSEERRGEAGTCLEGRSETTPLYPRQVVPAGSHLPLLAAAECASLFRPTRLAARKGIAVEGEPAARSFCLSHPSDKGGSRCRTASIGSAPGRRRRPRRKVSSASTTTRCG